MLSFAAHATTFHPATTCQAAQPREPRRVTTITKSPELDISAFIDAPPGLVMKAFFDVQALRAWWQVQHAVVSPRVLGPYAIQWPATDFSDELLGRLGGVFRGTVMQAHPTEGFFVADAYWLPPDGEPIGPMALHVAMQPRGPRHKGSDHTERFRGGRALAAILRGCRAWVGTRAGVVEVAAGEVIQPRRHDGSKGSCVRVR